MAFWLRQGTVICRCVLLQRLLDLGSAPLPDLASAAVAIMALAAELWGAEHSCYVQIEKQV
jgi:hypothetical protein